jgi:hypothetical protein
MKKKMNILLFAVAALTLIPFGKTTAQTTKTSVYTVDEMNEKASTLVGQTVQIKGIAQHVCATSGRKLFMSTPDGKKTFRVNAGTQFKRFDENILDSTVIATGVVTENKTTMEMLDKQEAAAIAAEKAKKEPEHCTSEAKANGENTSATPVQRIAALKEKLQKQISEGKNNYLSSYTINNCTEYHICK